MIIVLKAVYRFSAIPIKISRTFFRGIEKGKTTQNSYISTKDPK
jgi:hypothetical protein